ncbi:HEPN domain-containing protein [Faecalimonas sp.]
MNYAMYYDYENFSEVFECIPKVRHGAVIELFDCRVKFYTLSEHLIIFWVNGEKYSKEEAYEICKEVSKVLSYIFALPFYSKENQFYEVEGTIEKNTLFSKQSLKKVEYIENKVHKFKKTKTVFYQSLDLLVIAFDNLFKERDEDAFMFFFKVVERIAKEDYKITQRKLYNKSTKKRNKNKIKDFLRKYGLEDLQVQLTDDMLNNKTDLIYNKILEEFYGSTYNKIALFITKHNIDINVGDINKLVHLRNKIAHGDIIDEKEIENYVGKCEYLAIQLFSKFFFRKEYEKLHVTSYRWFLQQDPYK